MGWGVAGGSGQGRPDSGGRLAIVFNERKHFHGGRGWGRNGSAAGAIGAVGNLLRVHWSATVLT